MHKYIKGNKITPNRILQFIKNNHEYFKNDTFIILGRPGPCGKTWLCDQLRNSGYNAIEPGEFLLQTHISFVSLIDVNRRKNTMIGKEPYDSRVREEKVSYILLYEILDKYKIHKSEKSAE